LTSRHIPPWVAEVATEPLVAGWQASCGPVRRFDLTRYPAIAALAIRTADMAQGYPPACRHVLAGLPRHEGGPRICAQHPGAGLLCRACVREHMATHTDAEEHTCDECRLQVPTLSGAAFPLPVRSAWVRGLDGRRRKVPGPVLLGGIGLCGRCERREATR